MMIIVRQIVMRNCRARLFWIYNSVSNSVNKSSVKIKIEPRQIKLRYADLEWSPVVKTKRNQWKNEILIKVPERSGFLNFESF